MNCATTIGHKPRTQLALQFAAASVNWRSFRCALSKEIFLLGEAGHVERHQRSSITRSRWISSIWAMCGRLLVDKENPPFAALVGAAMCSAFDCGTQNRWPYALRGSG